MIVEYDNKTIAVKVSTAIRIVKLFYYYATPRLYTVLNHFISKVFASIEFARLCTDQEINLENPYQLPPQTRFPLGI
jgi:hypothetical protein